MKKICTIIIAICIVLLFNVYVYAADPFTLDESVDVELNGKKIINYTGGSGTVTWESSDTSVATVDGGYVKGLKIGEATITATRGSEVKTCKVKVIYHNIDITRNNETNPLVSLILDEYPTESLKAVVKDYDNKVVNDAKVTWSSSDTNIVTVDEDGTVTAVKAGKATITASAAGVTDTLEVTVANGPVFTNFDNAKYELLFDASVKLKITGITPNKDNNYWYIITSNNTKPTIEKNTNGSPNMDNFIASNVLRVNTEENYIYANDLDKYVELNQDLYLWVIEDVKLENAYNKENNTITHSTKIVVEGEKLERPELKLNEILKLFFIMEDTRKSDGSGFNDTTINFRFPSTVKNRKFRLKIGKITDNSILQKIKDKDYSGMTELLTYAKNNNSIYEGDLQTTSEHQFKNDKPIFQGYSLVEPMAYYYIYVEFDDENGKYYPVQGITLGQATKHENINTWYLYSYNDDRFEWTNLSSTDPDTSKKEDPEGTEGTKPTGKLPNAGSTTFIILAAMIVVVSTGVVCYKKYNWFRNIK